MLFFLACAIRFLVVNQVTACKQHNPQRKGGDYRDMDSCQGVFREG